MNAFAVILVAFVTSAATALGTVYVVERYHVFAKPEAPAPKKQAVPNLVGLTEADAKTNLGASGFSMMIAGREASATAEPGTVLRQAPPAGQTTEMGKAVSVTFAVAPPKVPDVVGQSVADATKTLQEAGYTVVVGEAAASAEHAAGLVAAQAPSAGGPLEKKGTVTLTPSSGGAEIQVPKFIGLSLNKARAEADKAKVKLTVQWVELAETESYVVLRQKPPAGESMKPDGEVTVVVNR